MAMSKMYDLAWEVNGEQITLEQDAGIGEVVRMDLHPAHVRLLATECGLLQGDLNAWRRVATLERRLCVLRDRVAELDSLLWSVPGYPAGQGPTEDCRMSDLVLTLADEFCADMGLLNANAEPTHSERIADFSEQYARTREDESEGGPVPRDAHGTQPESPREGGGLNRREERTRDVLICIMAMELYGWEPGSERSTGATELINLARTRGFRLSYPTVRKHLREAWERATPIVGDLERAR